MGEIMRWLVHDDQKGLYEFLFALALNILFLILSALLLGLLGDPTLAGRLAKGYGAAIKFYRTHGLVEEALYLEMHFTI